MKYSDLLVTILQLKDRFLTGKLKATETPSAGRDPKSPGPNRLKDTRGLLSVLNVKRIGPSTEPCGTS